MNVLALVIERDPLRYQDVPAMLVAWTQDAGGWAAFCVAIWLILALTGLFPFDRRKIPPGQTATFLICVALSAASYVILGVTYLPQLLAAVSESASPVTSARTVFWQGILLTLGGAFAIAAAGLALVVNLPRFSVRRIGAIARLSFKEALRRRVPYAFVILLAVFLFGNWYVPYKPELQVNTYVGLVFFAMWPLLLLSASVLGAFSIPNDVRQQTIHTLVTKPVERFEIVLGRFLGFVGLLTLILLVMTTLSLIYVLRNVDPAAAAESLMAREPAYGALSFENTDRTNQQGVGVGESVGREWDYRSYIGGPPLPGSGKKIQYAVWQFPILPASVADRQSVRCEFTFDVFRLDKGFENKAVSCSFVFKTWRFRPEDKVRYDSRLQEEQNKAQRKSDFEIADLLAEEFGYYEKHSKKLTDYHTEEFNVPGGLFRNALKEKPPSPEEAVEVRVKNDSTSVRVGMARYDLYFRLDNPESSWQTFWFAWNFFKGAIGLWFGMVLLCGLAIAVSTHLSGVIAWLITAMLFVGGLCQEFIKAVGEGKNFGGGPMEALFRIASRANISAPLQEGAASSVAQVSDAGFRWLIRRVLNLLPDVNRFALSDSVAEGFNVSGPQLWLNLLFLLGYLLPWALLAYYLIKWREIASQT